MRETAAQLRARADDLEAQATYAKWRAKGYWCGYTFGKGGGCSEEWLITVPCPQHTPTYRDEYSGGHETCRNCYGKGTIQVLRKIPAPQYDAPTPPEEYTPYE